MIVPDVVGLTRAAATLNLERAGLTFGVRISATDDLKPGRVISEAPKAGRRVRVTRLITLSVAKPLEVSPGVSCPSDPLLGIYHPDRLQVLGECAWFVGTVVATRPEDDGDRHIDIAPDPGFGHFLDAGDMEHQSRGLLVEIVQGQALPIPDVGEHISVFGTAVYDTTHGWNEIHPIWAMKYLDTGELVRALPPDPPLYNPDETDGGGGGGGSGSTGGSGGSNCDPSYTGACLQDGIGDYDCAGGSGNGPNYVDVTVRVVGGDPFGLDSDGDGFGCE
ncbi:MAG: PASTA domain-containing protein [Actinomycetota bacterium]